MRLSSGQNSRPLPFVRQRSGLMDKLKFTNTISCPNIFLQLLRLVGNGSRFVPIAKQTIPVDLVDPTLTSCLSAVPAQPPPSISPLLGTSWTGKADWPFTPSLESPIPLDAPLNANVKNPRLGESLLDLENVDINGMKSNTVHECVISGLSPSWELRFQPPHSPMKKFVMFDHSGGKGRIFLHPALVSEWSIATRESQESPNFVSQSSLMEKTGFQEGFGDTSANIAFPGNSGLEVKDTVATAFATLKSVRTDRLCNLVASCSKDVLKSCAVPTGESSSHVCCASAAAISGSLHENTEDLDALMSSDDDEINSTGHSPNDVTYKERHLESFVRSEDCKTPSKRRRCSWGKQESVNVDQREEELSDVSVLASSSLGATANSESSEYPSPLKTLKHDPVSLKVSYPLRTSFEKLDDVNWQLRSFPSGLSSSARRARKHKIKKTVRALRNIIPGGKCLDTAVVLDETIQYLKSLQHKVLKLEACRAAKTGE